MQGANLPPQTLGGKIAICTGASRGLGAEIALQLAMRGAKVCLCYGSPSSASRITQLKTRINTLGNGSSAFLVEADLEQQDAATQVVNATMKEFAQSIDILVNNAAVERQKPPDVVSAKDFAYVFNTNVRAPILLVQAVLPHLRRPGRIINISSVAARLGLPNMSLYASSKAAIEGLTRSWASDLGAGGTTVNAVAPGPFESEMLAKIPQEIVQSQRACTPVEKRIGTTLDVAEVVCWLASDESKWISGQVVNASGGWSMY